MGNSPEIIHFET